MDWVLETERLGLRELELDDANALAEVLSDPVAMEHYPAPFTRERVVAWIERSRELYRANGFALWAVIRKSDGRFLGDCGPVMQPVEGRQIPEVGYHIVPAEQRKGYATEAARASVGWVFEHTGFDTVCSLVVPGNAGSRAVAGRIHAHMREFTWERTGRLTCLYWTARDEWSVGGAPRE